MAELFSFYKETEEVGKPYQISLPWHLEYEEGDKHEDAGKIVYSLTIFGKANKLFVKELWKGVDIKEIENFLDFHFDEFKGKKEDWLRDVEQIVFVEIERRKSNHIRDKYIRKWFKNKRKSIITKPSTELETKQKQENIPIRAIALKYQILRIVHEHEGIDNNNKDNIAEKYGWVAKTSGKQLYDDYKKLFREEDRTNPNFIDNSEKTSYERSKANREKLLKIVINEFEKKGCIAALNKAKAELAILKRMKAQ